MTSGEAATDQHPAVAGDPGAGLAPQDPIDPAPAGVPIPPEPARSASDPGTTAPADGTESAPVDPPSPAARGLRRRPRPAPGWWARSPRPWLRHPAAVLCGALLAAATPSTAARLLGGDDVFPLPALAALAPMAGVLAVVACVPAAFARSRWLAGLGALLVALHLFWAVPDLVGTDNRLPLSAPGGDLRVLELNTFEGQADSGAVVRAVHEHRVDLLVLAETTPAFETALDDAGVRTELPYLWDLPRAAPDVMLRSRWPITDCRAVWLSISAIPEARIRVPGGAEVSVLGVHVVSPKARAVGEWQSDLTKLTQLGHSVHGPTVFVGDFNAGTVHAPFRRLLGTGLVDAASVRSARPDPWWWAPLWTWPADLSVPPFVRIDHVLVTPSSIAVRSVRTVAVPGTDHLGVLASLRVARATG